MKRAPLFATLLGLTFLLYLAAFIESIQNNLFISSSKLQLIGFIWGLITIFSLSVFLLFFTIYWQRFYIFIYKIIQWNGNLKRFAIFLVPGIIILYSFLVFGNLGKYFTGFFFRTAVMWLFSCLGAVALKSFNSSRKIITDFFFMLLLTCAVYQAASYLRDISTYPFSLTWSEGSRFYYASLPFARQLYGQNLPLSFLHPSRYLIIALPFLVYGLPLWVHRAWQVFLWLSTMGLAAFLIVRRLNLSDPMKKAALAAWIFTFLFQAPVYYHLMICVVLILWGFDLNHYKKSLLIVIMASLWAGISRINWFPLPGMLAAMLYFLEERFKKTESWWDYFKRPLSYVAAGMAASLIAQAAYIPLSGNQDIKSFTTSFTSDLLWYRLLPSPTFPIGILTGILLLCAPLLILVLVNFWQNISQINNWRMLSMAVILAVFFIGGLVVSVKIGGGSNLHNLDAFMVLLICVGTYIFFNQIIRESQEKLPHLWLPNLLLIGIVLIPVGWSSANWEAFPIYDRAGVQQDLKTLNQTVQKTALSRQEILFISERQLLTYQYLKDVPLVSDYELLTLTEMSISHDQDYFMRFEKDLENQRFGLIIAPKEYVVFKDRTTTFPEENNAWRKYVTIPLMQYYQPITWLHSAGLEIFARRQRPSP